MSTDEELISAVEARIERQFEKLEERVDKRLDRFEERFEERFDRLPCSKDLLACVSVSAASRAKRMRIENAASLVLAGVALLTLYIEHFQLRR
jgi:hypothetical protein